MDYRAGIVRLSSSDGTLLEIPEGKLSPEDSNYVRSLDVYKKGELKVISYHSYFLAHPLRLFGTGTTTRYVASPFAYCFPVV